MLARVRLVTSRPLGHLDAQVHSREVHAVLPALDTLMPAALVLDCSAKPTALARLSWVLPQGQRAPPPPPPLVRPTPWNYSNPQDPMVAVLGKVAAAVSIGLSATNQHASCMWNDDD